MKNTTYFVQYNKFHECYMVINSDTLVAHSGWETPLAAREAAKNLNRVRTLVLIPKDYKKSTQTHLQSALKLVVSN